jgi:hypothetical protein
MTKRREALEDFQCDLKVMDKFINETEVKALVNIIDPSFERLESFGHELESVLCWVDKEIEVELEKENDLLPDEGNPGYAVGQ